MDKRMELAGIELTEDTETFAEAWQALQKVVKDMWEQIKEFIDNHNTTTDTRPERKGWRIPRKIIRDHQVFDKRPRVIYIRSEI